MSKRTEKSLIRRVAYSVTQNPLDAEILTTIWWWQPYASVMRDGRHWIIRTDREFTERDGIAASERAIRASLKRLRDARLIETTRGPHRFAGRPNARYVRLLDGVADHLESSAKGLLEKRRQPGVRNRVQSQIKEATPSSSSRQKAPVQNGTANRFHKQEENTQTDIGSAKSENTRQRAEALDGPERLQEGKTSSFSVDWEKFPELSRIQSSFDAGCRVRGWMAPAVNNRMRFLRLQQFWGDCQEFGLDIEWACAVAQHFASKFDRSVVASELARPKEKVSATPDHFNLALCSNYAIGSYREHWIEEALAGHGGFWIGEDHPARRQLRDTWPNCTEDDVASAARQASAASTE